MLKLKMEMIKMLNYLKMIKIIKILRTRKLKEDPPQLRKGKKKEETSPKAR
jgi:hypothetical protein